MATTHLRLVSKSNRPRRASPRPMRADRLAVSTLCKYSDPDSLGTVTAMVIGTWAFTGAVGAPGAVKTREQRWRADPRTDETAHGYLLLPTGGTGFIYAHFGDVITGDLTAIA